MGTYQAPHPLFNTCMAVTPTRTCSSCWPRSFRHPELQPQGLSSPARQRLEVHRGQASLESTARYRNESDHVLMWFDASVLASPLENRVPVMDLFEYFVAYLYEASLPTRQLQQFHQTVRTLSGNHAGQPWVITAADGIPFSMTFRRSAQSWAYEGNLQLVRCDD